MGETRSALSARGEVYGEAGGEIAISCSRSGEMCTGEREG